MHFWFQVLCNSQMHCKNWSPWLAYYVKCTGCVPHNKLCGHLQSFLALTEHILFFLIQVVVDNVVRTTQQNFYLRGQSVSLKHVVSDKEIWTTHTVIHLSIVHMPRQTWSVYHQYLSCCYHKHSSTFTHFCDITCITYTSSNWWWISNGMTSFTCTNWITLCTSTFDHVSSRSPMFKKIVWWHVMVQLVEALR